jgi:hypothetical protein
MGQRAVPDQAPGLWIVASVRHEDESADGLDSPTEGTKLLPAADVSPCPPEGLGTTGLRQSKACPPVPMACEPDAA